MTEEQIQAQFNYMAELLDLIDGAIDLANNIKALPFHALTPDTWASIQDAQDPLLSLVNVFRDSMKLTATAMDNQALMSHIQAVTDQLR